MNYKLLKQWDYLAVQKINRQNEKRKKVQSLEVTDVVLVQFNLVNNQYQQKSEVIK